MRAGRTLIAAGAAASVLLTAVSCWCTPIQPRIQIQLSGRSSGAQSIQLTIDVTSDFECRAMDVRVELPAGLSARGVTEWTAATGPGRSFARTLDIDVVSQGSWRLRVWAETSDVPDCLQTDLMMAVESYYVRLDESGNMSHGQTDPAVLDALAAQRGSLRQLWERGPFEPVLTHGTESETTEVSGVKRAASPPEEIALRLKAEREQARLSGSDGELLRIGDEIWYRERGETEFRKLPPPKPAEQIGEEHRRAVGIDPYLSPKHEYFLVVRSADDLETLRAQGLTVAGEPGDTLFLSLSKGQAKAILDSGLPLKSGGHEANGRGESGEENDKVEKHSQDYRALAGPRTACRLVEDFEGAFASGNG